MMAMMMDDDWAIKVPDIHGLFFSKSSIVSLSSRAATRPLKTALGLFATASQHSLNRRNGNMRSIVMLCFDSIVMGGHWFR